MLVTTSGDTAGQHQNLLVTTTKVTYLFGGPMPELTSDNNQGDLFYSAGQNRNLLLATTKVTYLFGGPMPELISDNDQGDLFQSTGHHEN